MMRLKRFRPCKTWECERVVYHLRSQAKQGTCQASGCAGSVLSVCSSSSCLCCALWCQSEPDACISAVQGSIMPRLQTSSRKQTYNDLLVEMMAVLFNLIVSGSSTYYCSWVDSKSVLYPLLSNSSAAIYSVCRVWIAVLLRMLFWAKLLVSWGVCVHSEKAPWYEKLRSVSSESIISTKWPFAKPLTIGRVYNYEV